MVFFPARSGCVLNRYISALCLVSHSELSQNKIIFPNFKSGPRSIDNQLGGPVLGFGIGIDPPFPIIAWRMQEIGALILDLNLIKVMFCTVALKVGNIFSVNMSPHTTTSISVNASSPSTKNRPSPWPLSPAIPCPPMSTTLPTNPTHFPTITCHQLKFESNNNKLRCSTVMSKKTSNLE